MGSNPCANLDSKLCCSKTVTLTLTVTKPVTFLFSPSLLEMSSSSRPHKQTCPCHQRRMDGGGKVGNGDTLSFLHSLSLSLRHKPPSQTGVSSHSPLSSSFLPRDIVRSPPLSAVGRALLGGGTTFS